MENNNIIVNDIDEYLKNNKVNEIAKLDLKTIQESIRKSYSIIHNNKVQLAFVGKSHAGKTTVISSILGMYFYDENNKIIQVMQSDVGGRTTPCTVEIIPCEENRIEIEPISKNEIKGIINEYCLFMTKNNGNISEEIRTIINRRLEKDLREQLRNIKDVKEANKIVLEKINFQELNTELVRLKCNKTNKNEVFKWINKNLQDIRKGRLEYFLIPNKISIYVNKSFISVPDNISKIIDTRGISSETIKNSNSITSRKDLDEYIKNNNTLVIYINEFSSVEEGVADFYYEKFRSLGTQPEELVKFMVLVNARSGSIESKIECEDEREEYIEDKKLEFINAVMISEDDELLDEPEIRKKYDYIKDTISNAGGEICNFTIYEPLKSIHTVEELGQSYFVVKDENEVLENRKKINNEIKKITNVRDNIIKETLEADIQKAKGYISKQIGLASNTVIGGAVNSFNLHINKETKDIIGKWIKTYIEQFWDLTNKMDGRTVAAYVRGYGTVVSRMENIVDDTYYFYQSNRKLLEQLLERMICNEIILFKEKIDCISDQMDNIKPEEIMKKDAIDKVKVFVDYVSDRLINSLESTLVGNAAFWNSVSIYRQQNCKKYAESLYIVGSQNFKTQQYVSNFGNQYIKISKVLK